MSATRVTYPKTPSGFQAAVKQRADAYFAAAGAPRIGHLSLWFKTSLFLGVMAATYAGVLSGRFAGPATLGLALLHGLACVLFVFNTAHDATHGTYSQRPWVNRVMGFAWNLAGISSSNWSLKHNLSHHVFTNVMGIDNDIDGGGAMRLHPGDPRRPFHRLQHLYGPLLYSFMSLITIFVQDLEWQRKRRFGNREFPRGRSLASWVELVATKLVYVGYSLVVPLLVLDYAWWQVSLGYLAMHVVIGQVMTFILQTVHVTEGTRFTRPDAEGRLDRDWAVHQVEATVDVAADSRLVTWLTGGLNAHTAHHLYPRVCHAHAFALTKLIRETAAEYGVRYQNRSLWQALVTHLRFLRRLGREDALPEDATVPPSPALAA